MSFTPTFITRHSLRCSSSAAFLVILATLFLDMVGFGIIIPILPRYAEHFGATPFQIGLIIGVFSLAQLTMMPIWGGLSDRIGRKPVLLLSVFGTAVGYFIMGFSHTVLMMITARIIDGIAGGNLGAAQAYISDITKPEEHSKAMGLLGAACGLGFFVGPALGGLISYHYGFSFTMYLAGALAVLNLFLITVFLPESLYQKKRTSVQLLPQFFKLWQHVDKKVYLPVLLTFFFYNTAVAIVTTSFALFLYHHYQFNEQQTGSTYAMIGLIVVIVQGCLFGMLSKKWSNQYLAKIGFVLIIIGFFIFPITCHVEIMIALCVINVFAQSLIGPSLPSIISRGVKNEWYGAAFGFFQSMGSLGRFLGPLLAGYFLAIDLHGPAQNYARTAYWASSGLLVIAFFIIRTVK